jgi:hypothetical protein
MFVFQLQLTRPLHVVPNRRDYIAQREAQLKALERERESYRPLA